MKLIFQIPCFNEVETLPETISALPRQVPGFDIVETLVVDDGSTDGTSDVARALGVDHIVRISRNRGLANAFRTGLIEALRRHADVIVNTDADNQYDASNIPDLLKPIVDGVADMVIGARPLMSIAHFSLAKRFYQKAGTYVVQAFSGTKVQDATSGFRAITADTARRLNVFGQFTYTLETIIQAGLNNLRVVSVPIRVNPPTRPSRLFRSNFSYIARSAITIVSVFLIYRPCRFFLVLSFALLIPGLFLGIRYLLLMYAGEGARHIQSVIASGVFVTSGLLLMVVATIAYLQTINRKLLEDIKYELCIQSSEQRTAHDQRMDSCGSEAKDGVRCSRPYH